MRIRPEDIRPYHLTPAGENSSALTPEGWTALPLGLHLFYSPAQSDLFFASISEQVSNLGPGMVVESSTDENLEGEPWRIEAEQWRRRIADRTLSAGAPNNVDAHNSAVLEEDLKDDLSQPKTRRRGFQRLSVYEAAVNTETGKIIALLPSESGYARWTQDYPRFCFMGFHPTSHTLVSLEHKSFPPSLQRAINLFNDRFGNKGD